MRLLRNVFVLSAFIQLFLPNLASAETRPEFKAQPSKLEVEAGFPTTINLRDLLSDIGSGGVLVWNLLPNPAPPAFVTFNAAAEQLTITPPLTGAGLYRFKISATRRGEGFDLGSLNDVELTVKVFQGPKWTGNPITLPNATEDSLYSQNVNTATYVTYNETDPLTFEVFDGTNRAWVAMSKAGVLEGMPLRANGGAVLLNARVSANHRGTVFKDETVLKFDVKLINKPPKWTQNPLVLPDAFTRQPYPAQDLKPFVTDPDANTNFTFRIVDPATSPNWATITGSSFSGTPQNVHLGLNEWVVEVSDGQLTALTKVQVTVKNRPPKWKIKPTVLKPNATEDSLFKAALAPYATDPESDPLIFTLISGPGWATVNANGELEGTPRRPNDLGLQKFMIRVSDALSGGGDDAEVQVTVDKINKAPKWTADDIFLPDAPERSAYTQMLSQYVSDPDNDTLTFRKINAAEGPWVTIGGTGSVTGTPIRQHVGDHVMSVEVKDPGGLTAVAKVHIKVLKVNRAPVCQSPAALKDALQEAAFADDVNRLVTDADADKLAFKPITVPGWMTAGTDGKLSGTPQEADIGNYKAEFEVTDPDGAMCKLVADGKVLRANWKPEIKEPIQFTVKERQIFTVSLKDPKYVEDKDPNDVLTFTLIDMVPWVSLTSVGTLTLKPEYKQIGTHTFKFTVSDGKVTIPGTFTVIVVRDPRPPKWLQDPIRFTATAGVAFIATLKDKVQDLDGLPIAFTGIGQPAWLAIAADGGLSGTPLEANVGLNTFKVRAANDALGADVTVIIDVKSANQPPKWTKNPIILPDAVVGENYAQRISDYATDADPNDRLTFKLLTASPWVFVTSSGLFFGTPAMTDLGLNKVMVQVSDGKATADAEVQVRVVNKNQKPKWAKDPIDLGTAYVGKAFTFNLTGLATDPDGTPLTFRKMPGAAPMWLQVSAGGQVFGTPAETDLGAYTTILEVSDNGVEWVPVNAFGKVVKESMPPKLNAAALMFTVRANEVFNERLNQALYVTYGGDRTKLKFESVQTLPAWIKLAMTGDLELRPKDSEIGDHTFTLKVTDTDSNLTDQAPVKIKVIAGKQVPKWAEDPIRYDAIVNKPFSASLVGKVINPDNVTLTFAKGSGKPWLTVASNGAMSGTPMNADLGENFFTVSFTWDGGTVNATLIVKVIPDGPNDDSVIIDDPVPGARSDNLWIVDNTRDQCSGQSCFIQELRDSIDAFYNEMERARIEHYGVYLSADACTYRAPIRDARGQVLLTHGDRNWVSGFNYRISKTPGDPMWNSSLTALWQFLYDSVASVPAPYFDARVPMDVLMMSPSSDKYTNFTHHTAPHWQPIANWTPAKYLKDAQDAHKNAEKNLRISALAVSNSAYQTMVSGTKGSYFTYGSSQMEDQLYNYAQEVIFRAYVAAKKRIKLTKTPTDPTTIVVTIGGRKLAANQWSYDKAANEVEIYWHLIDMSQLKPGERLVIQYR